MKKALISLALMLGMTAGTYAAFDLTFQSIGTNDPILNKFSVVHFTLPDLASNNFQGGFFWLPTQQLLPAQAVTFNGVTKNCSKRVRGLYYTNAKGSRLWPLDQQTLNGLKLLNPDYNNLQINGGLYTTCGTSGSTEIYSIYGQINYVDLATMSDLGTLSAGMMYNASDNTVDTSLGLYQTFQYFNNQTPLGYIFDNVGGIGFVGGLLPPNIHVDILNEIKNNGGYINSIFQFAPGTQDIIASVGGTNTFLGGNTNAGMDTLWNISVLGNVLLSRGGLDVADRQSVLGNPGTSSAVVFSDVINTSDILNKLRKNSDSLCRGQEKLTVMTPNAISDFIASLGYTPKVICVYNDIGGSEYNTTYGSDVPFYIDLSQSELYNGIEFVVKGRNVMLEGSMPSNQDALNIFVDNGNVLLKNGTFAQVVENGPLTNTNYAVFDAKGGMLNEYNTVTQKVIQPQLLNLPVGAAAAPVWNWNNANYPQVGGAGVFNILSQMEAANIGNPDMEPGEIVGSVNYGVYLRGNIFVNGLIVGTDPADLPSAGISNKYYIHGRLASLNTALEPSLPRRELIGKMFGTNPMANGELLQDLINFNQVFQFECGVNGTALDPTGTPTNQPCRVKGDAFKFNPIVLINTGVPTKLLP